MEGRNYFNLHRIALRVGCNSLKDHETTLYKVWSYVGYLLIIYPFLALGDLFKHDFETVADLLTYEFPIFVGFAKFVGARANLRKLRNLLDKLDTEDIFITAENRETEKVLMNRCFFITTLQTSTYWILSLSFFLFAVVYTFLKRLRSSDHHDWLLPYGTFTLIGVDRSPNFEISWAYQCLACAFIGVQFATMDMLMAALLCHVYFKLKILQNCIRRIVENSYNRQIKESGLRLQYDDEKNDKVQWRFLNHSLKEVVRAHLYIINISKEIDQSFSFLLLVVFLGTLAILAFMVYKLSLLPLTDMRLLRSFGEITVAVLQIFLVCFWSELVMAEAESVGRAVYDASFVGTDLRFQRSLVLLMRRSQTPIALSAGGFVNISLATFTWVMRTTYSAYMVLRNHNAAEK